MPVFSIFFRICLGACKPPPPLAKNFHAIPLPARFVLIPVGFLGAYFFF